MKAYVLRSYGSADVMHLADVDKPVPADDEVLVRVRATSVNPYDWHYMRGEPYLARVMPGGLGVRNGTLVVVGGPAGRWLQPAGHMFAALAVGPFVSQRVAMADTTRCAEKTQNLMTLTGLIENGTITPVIDRCYPFEEVRAAISYQEQGHAAGKVVVTVRGEGVKMPAGPPRR